MRRIQNLTLNNRPVIQSTKLVILLTRWTYEILDILHLSQLNLTHAIVIRHIRLNLLIAVIIAPKTVFKATFAFIEVIIWKVVHVCISVSWFLLLFWNVIDASLANVAFGHLEIVLRWAQVFHLCAERSPVGRRVSYLDSWLGGGA